MIGNLGVSLLAMVLLAACQQAQGPSSAPSLPPSGHQVQVVAHPDDDILFMNPDLAAGIHSGQPTTSIYLTGGESDMPHPSEYASHRQDGTRAAYASMAGAPDYWIRRELPVANRAVEVDTLVGRPHVALVFLNLPEDNDPGATGGKHALTRLLGDHSGLATVHTIVQNTGTVRQSYPYRRDDVPDVLDALFDSFRASVIRAQDPQPDVRYQADWGRDHDHPDHVATARFTHEAAQRYLSGPGHHATEVHYRDYNIAESPINLSARDQDDKRRVFATYVRHDVGASLDGSYQDWTRRSYYRWSRGSAWSGVDGRGQVHAFAASGAHLLHRTRDAAWRPPQVSIAPAPLRPAVAVVADTSGTLALVAQTWDGSQVLLKRQLSPGGRWQADWTSLGSPGKDTTQVGVPVVTADWRGRIAVFLHNADGGVSMRRERAPGHGWEDWTSLGGSDVQDGLAAVTGEDGRLHVFAPAEDRVLHWREGSSGAFQPASTPFRKIQPASPLAATRAPGGRTNVVVRTGDSGALAAVSAAPQLGWQVPARIGDAGGMAAPAVVGRHSIFGPEFVVFVRNSAGGVSACRTDGHWTDLGGHITDQPTAVVEPDGSISLLAIADDASLVVNQEVAGAPTLTFGGWHPATT